MRSLEEESKAYDLEIEFDAVEIKFDVEERPLNPRAAFYTSKRNPVPNARNPRKNRSHP